MSDYFYDELMLSIVSLCMQHDENKHPSFASNMWRSLVENEDFIYLWSNWGGLLVHDETTAKPGQIV